MQQSYSQQDLDILRQQLKDAEADKVNEETKLKQ